MATIPVSNSNPVAAVGEWIAQFDTLEVRESQQRDGASYYFVRFKILDTRYPTDNTVRQIGASVSLPTALTRRTKLRQWIEAAIGRELDEWEEIDPERDLPGRRVYITIRHKTEAGEVRDYLPVDGALRALEPRAQKPWDRVPTPRHWGTASDGDGSEGEEADRPAERPGPRHAGVAEAERRTAAESIPF